MWCWLEGQCWLTPWADQRCKQHFPLKSEEMGMWWWALSATVMCWMETSFQCKEIQDGAWVASDQYCPWKVKKKEGESRQVKDCGLEPFSLAWLLVSEDWCVRERERGCDFYFCQNRTDLKRETELVLLN